MIQKIEVLNYRCLRYNYQAVQQFQVLVGPASSGKSTFLDVVALLGDFVRYGVDDALLFGVKPEHGRARSLDELIFNQASDHFELAVEFGVPPHLQNHKAPYDVARYEVAFGKSASGELEIRTEILWLIDRRARATVRSESASPPYSILHTGETQTGWRVAARKSIYLGNDYYRAETGRWNIRYKVGERRAALSGLPEDDRRFPIAMWVRNLLLEGVQVVTLNSAAMRRPANPSASRRMLSADGSNLPLLIRDLERHHHRSHQNWMAYVRTMLPDIENVRIYERPEDRHLYLALKYAGIREPVPSWLISGGTMRLLALTLLAYLPNQSDIYLIEEPENGIHPSAVEGIFQSLSSGYGGQILIATQSPLFRELVEGTGLLYFIRNLSGDISIVSGEY